MPDTETKIKIAADSRSLDTGGIKWVVNPYDEFAIEEAVKIKEANAGAQVHVISVGPKKRTVEAVRTALAMGADEGILVDSPENIDAGVAATALAAVIEKEGGARIILTGKLAIDDNAASVPQILAEKLKIPHVTVVSKLNISSDEATAERDVEGGAKEVIKISGPVVIAANKGLNMPRYASLPGIMKAKKKVMKEYDLSALGVTTNNQLVTTALELPPDKPAARLLSGDVATQVKDLVRSLRDEAKVL